MRKLSLFPSSLWGWIRGAVSVCLALMLMHFAITGSPIPLWHLEKLSAPEPVQAIQGNVLVLADGREVRLPWIKELPKDHPLFQAAVQEGVEIRSDGRVFGLLWMERYCGNDPYLWKRLKIDLSELAGAIHPEGLDTMQVNPEAIVSLAKNTDPQTRGSNRNPTVCSLRELSGMQRIRRQVEHVSKVQGE